MHKINNHHYLVETFMLSERVSFHVNICLFPVLLHRIIPYHPYHFRTKLLSAHFLTNSLLISYIRIILSELIHWTKEFSWYLSTTFINVFIDVATCVTFYITFLIKFFIANFIFSILIFEAGDIGSCAKGPFHVRNNSY